MSKPDIAQPTERWTRIDDYLGALARRRTARRARQQAPRTQPESPRLMLSTLPIAALILVLAVLVVAFAVAALPGSNPEPAPRPVVQQKAGTASPGWFDEAKKDMR